MSRALIILLALCASAVYAQQQTPMEQALSTKLSSEIGMGLQCNAAFIALQARVKELEAKLESKGDK